MLHAWFLQYRAVMAYMLLFMMLYQTQVILRPFHSTFA